MREITWCRWFPRFSICIQPLTRDGRLRIDEPVTLAPTLADYGPWDIERCHTEGHQYLDRCPILHIDRSSEEARPAPTRLVQARA